MMRIMWEWMMRESMVYLVNQCL
uniref:Uncharacterized protein n=1 Tax=Arundo donax TaxID=35708 RepID=A0A0A8ZFU9_ARUDO